MNVFVTVEKFAMEEHPRDYADPNSLGSERNKTVNGPCTLDYYEDKVQKRTERSPCLCTQKDHGQNDGPKPCPNRSTDAQVIAMNLFPSVKRRRLINILVGKEGPF